MRFTKTPQSKRTSYTYRFKDGSKITLKPGKDGVTEEHIRLLHALDDSEVYHNIKNSRPPLTDSEKGQKSNWKKAHPGEEYPANWNLSMDLLSERGNNDSDKNHILFVSHVYSEPEEDDNQVIDSILDCLTDIQRTVVYTVKIQGYTQTEAAEILGTSIPNINKHLARAMLRIKKQKDCKEIPARG